MLFGLTALAQTPEEEKRVLEQELKAIEDKIAQYEKEFGSVQKEKETLQKQVKLLTNKINKLSLEIKQGNLRIKRLTGEISETEKAISRTLARLNETRDKLKASLQILYQENRKSSLEIFLAENSLASFFQNISRLETFSAKVAGSLSDVKSLKQNLEDEKKNLDDQKDDLQKIIGVQILQKQDSENSKKQQEKLLETTKGKESLYQQYLEESKKRAAEIRSRLFEIIGVPQAPTFGQAYEIAKFVSQATGVRPALLLAVITQESNLGKNVGQCNCAGSSVCKHPELSWKEVMKESRDWQPFLQITRELGRDPNSTPVSCPMYLNGKRFGFGGAMGPAQFMPSIWVKYKSRIEEISGRKPADPWNIRDAFLAAGLYLKDFGAASQKYNDEWRSAMIYFSGSTNSKYRFYGDSVMNIAKGLEDDIKALAATDYLWQIAQISTLSDP
jgi:peptidoglycan hydrolase CwlO-like protein